MRRIHEVRAEGFGPNSHSRRGFLGIASRVGITVVGASAGIVGTAASASAHTWRCCDLEFGQPNCPINGQGDYYCTQGTMKSWCCCSGARTYNCGECTTGSTCEYGVFYCSAGWTSSPNHCVSGCPSGVAHADPFELSQWRNGTYPAAPAPAYVNAHPELFTKHR